MVKPEDITVSLETAKALQEAGYPQRNSVFYYWRRYLGPEDKFKESPALSYGRACRDVGDPLPYKDHYAAPTFNEILRQLPNIYQWIVVGCLDNGKYRVMPTDSVTNTKTKVGDVRLDSFDADSPADAISNLYIYLSNNNLL